MGRATSLILHIAVQTQIQEAHPPCNQYRLEERCGPVSTRYTVSRTLRSSREPDSPVQPQSAAPGRRDMWWPRGSTRPRAESTLDRLNVGGGPAERQWLPDNGRRGGVPWSGAFRTVASRAGRPREAGAACPVLGCARQVRLISSFKAAMSASSESFGRPGFRRPSSSKALTLSPTWTSGFRTMRTLNGISIR